MTEGLRVEGARMEPAAKGRYRSAGGGDSACSAGERAEKRER